MFPPVWVAFAGRPTLTSLMAIVRTSQLKSHSQCIDHVQTKKVNRINIQMIMKIAFVDTFLLIQKTVSAISYKHHPIPTQIFDSPCQTHTKIDWTITTTVIHLELTTPTATITATTMKMKTTATTTTKPHNKVTEINIALPIHLDVTMMKTTITQTMVTTTTVATTTATVATTTTDTITIVEMEMRIRTAQTDQETAINQTNPMNKTKFLSQWTLNGNKPTCKLIKRKKMTK